MKKIIISLIICFNLFSKEVSWKDVDTINGLVYDSSNKLFTGTVITEYKFLYTNYVNGKKHGKESQYYKDGQLKYKIEYMNGAIVDGEYTSYYKNGNIMEIVNYLNEEINGEKYEYYYNGQLKYEIKYKNGAIVDGEYTSYYKNGNIMEVVNYLNREINGEKYEYYYNGQLKYKKIYKDGNLVDGKYTSYHENGNIMEIVNYLNGEINGEKYEYYYNGQLKYKKIYKDGNLVDGKYTSYHENGNIMEVVNYLDGNIDGRKYNYHKDGQLKYKAKYENGILIKAYKIHSIDKRLLPSSSYGIGYKYLKLDCNCSLYSLNEKIYPENKSSINWIGLGVSYSNSDKNSKFNFYGYFSYSELESLLIKSWNGKIGISNDKEMYYGIEKSLSFFYVNLKIGVDIYAKDDSYFYIGMGFGL